jgi:tetratricopeptide (TPR) repeat protein
LIVSIEDGSANINLGSLDGLAKGSELQVFRGSNTVGRLQVTAVFRDRSRASAIEGKQLRPKDEVRVGGADHLSAVLQQVDAAFNRGDPNTAIKLAEEAVRWGESAAVPPGAMAASWNQLAVLHMLRGEYGGAESLLLRAASASKTDPVYGQIKNNLGVLAELRGDRDKAAASYNDARGASPGDQRQIVERNLSRVRGSR